MGYSIDKRINYLIGLDTETCNGIMRGDKLDLSDSLVYDIGWVVTDKRGRIYKERSFIVREIFINMKDVMQSAYYADKIPQYWEDVKAKKRVVASFWTIRKTLFEDMKEYNIHQVFAHNARFDVNALNCTTRWLSKSNIRYFFRWGTEIWDTLKMARSVVAKMPTYQRYCIDNNYMTKHKVPQVRLTAEILYRFISFEEEFSESHTGLEDVLIETQILAYCFRQHKAMNKLLYRKGVK